MVGLSVGIEVGGPGLGLSVGLEVGFELGDPSVGNWVRPVAGVGENLGVGFGVGAVESPEVGLGVGFLVCVGPKVSGPRVGRRVVTDAGPGVGPGENCTGIRLGISFGVGPEVVTGLGVGIKACVGFVVEGTGRGATVVGAADTVVGPEDRSYNAIESTYGPRLRLATSRMVRRREMEGIRSDSWPHVFQPPVFFMGSTPTTSPSIITSMGQSEVPAAYLTTRIAALPGGSTSNSIHEP